jgi:hypothetical protein
MENQLEYQRNIIREEYVKEADIDKRIEEGIAVKPISSLSKKRDKRVIEIR